MRKYLLLALTILTSTYIWGQAKQFVSADSLWSIKIRKKVRVEEKYFKYIDEIFNVVPPSLSIDSTVLLSKKIGAAHNMINEGLTSKERIFYQTEEAMPLDLNGDSGYYVKNEGYAWYSGGKNPLDSNIKVGNILSLWYKDPNEAKADFKKLCGYFDIIPTESQNEGEGEGGIRKTENDPLHSVRILLQHWGDDYLLSFYYN